MAKSCHSLNVRKINKQWRQIIDQFPKAAKSFDNNRTLLMKALNLYINGGGKKIQFITSPIYYILNKKFEQFNKKNNEMMTIHLAPFIINNKHQTQYLDDTTPIVDTQYFVKFMENYQKNNDASIAHLIVVRHENNVKKEKNTHCTLSFWFCAPSTDAFICFFFDPNGITNCDNNIISSFVDSLKNAKEKTKILWKNVLNMNQFNMMNVGDINVRVLDGSQYGTCDLGCALFTVLLFGLIVEAITTNVHPYIKDDVVLFNKKQTHFSKFVYIDFIRKVEIKMQRLIKNVWNDVNEVIPLKKITKFKCNNQMTEQMDLDDDLEENKENEEFEIEQIIGHAEVSCSGKNKTFEFQVKWKGYPAATWEPQKNFSTKVLQNYWHEAKKNAQKESDTHPTDSLLYPTTPYHEHVKNPNLYL